MGVENMAKAKQVPQDPGPGRATADASFKELCREVAQRNEEAHKQARKLRAVRDREQMLQRRRQDLL